MWKIKEEIKLVYKMRLRNRCGDSSDDNVNVK